MTWKKYGRAVRRAPGVMNKLEADYCDSLNIRRITGEIQLFMFDAVKLRLADKTFYTPDFFVVNENGEIEIHEVKGHWEDDARVKIKVAAQMFPFRFKAITKEKGQWKEENF